MIKKIICISLLGFGLVAVPALAQNRFMDEAKERAARRADNVAEREAENPPPAKPAAATPAPAAATAPAAPAAAPAAPAPAAPAAAAPAPATPAQ